jgi:hypothetical protein
MKAAIDVVWFGQRDGSMISRLLKPNSENDLKGVGVYATDFSAGREVPRIGDDAYPGLGLTIAQFDQDSQLEIFVANDGRPNHFWNLNSESEGDRSTSSVSGATSIFSDTASVVGLATSSRGSATASMGIASADFDRNGRLDLLVTNWYGEWITHCLQNQQGMFLDQAPTYGLDKLSEHSLGFGVQAIDLDNNGWHDLVIGNGHIDDYDDGIPFRMPTQVLLNLGLSFSEVHLRGRQPIDDEYWNRDHLARCLIRCDFESDGKVDAVITDLLEPSVLLKNESDTGNHYIQVELVATKSERSAVGAVVSVIGEEPAQLAVMTGADGYYGRNEPMLHFGLGSSQRKTVDIEVRWPNGERTVYESMAVDRRHLVLQSDSISHEY